MYSGIELVLFDFGGVIAPEGFELGILKMSMIFNKTYDEMYRLAGYTAAQEKGYTSGHIGERQYWDIVRNLLGQDSDMFSYRNYFIDNFVPRPDMIELIKKTSKQKKTGIFSDQTNWIYEINDKIAFMDTCDFRFISYDLGCTKYDDKFYDIPSEISGIDSSSILVVDDKEKVLHKCSSKGMKTLLFISVEQCIGFFERELGI